jgi:hypothetical protein
MTITVFFVHCFLNQLMILNKTLGITTRYELQLVIRRFLKGKLSGATIEQYSFDVTVIIRCDVILNRI